MASSIASLVKYLLKYIFSISRLAVVIVGTVKNSDRLLCVSEYVFSVWECVCVQCVRVCVCSVCSVCVCSVCEWVYVFSVWVSVCVQCVSECMCSVCEWVYVFSVWVSVCVSVCVCSVCESVCVFSVWVSVCVQCVSECMCSVCEWVYVWVCECTCVCLSLTHSLITYTRSTAQRTQSESSQGRHPLCGTHTIFVGKYLIDWFFTTKERQKALSALKHTLTHTLNT